MTRHWQMQDTLTVIESLETHVTDAWGRYLLHHPDELAVTNPPATLFTVMRYLGLPNPGFYRSAPVDALSNMIAGYASSAWGRKQTLTVEPLATAH